MVKVSIILPNYNHASFLRQRIESILNQRFQDFELIILDDCSTDNSKAIIEEYKSHPRISQIIYNENNSGSTFSQWEKGITIAKGDYIWIAESDDYCEPTLLDELVTPLLNDITIHLSFCQSVLISSETNEILDLTKTQYLSEVLDGKTFIKNHLFATNEILNASMVVFRKNVVTSFPESFSKMKYCGDWYMWVNLCLKGKIFISGKYLNYYRRHNNSTITKASSNGYDFLEGNQIFKIIEKSVDINPEEKQAALERKLWTYHFLKPYFKDEIVLNNVNQSMLDLNASFDLNNINPTNNKGNFFLRNLSTFLKKLSFKATKLYENSTH